MKQLLPVLAFCIIIFVSCGGDADDLIIEDKDINVDEVIIIDISNQDISNEAEYIDERHLRLTHDINQLRNFILTRHPRFTQNRFMQNREYMDEEENILMLQEFNESIDVLLENIHYLSEDDIIIEIQRALSVLKDNHIFFNEFIYLIRYRYPVIFSWLDDGFYLLASHAEYSEALNLRLNAVNGVAIDTILDEFSRLWCVENIYDTRFRLGMTLGSPILLNLLTGNEGESVYSFICENGYNLEIRPGNVFNTLEQVEFEYFMNEMADNRADGESSPGLSNDWTISVNNGVLHIIVPRWSGGLDVLPELRNVFENNEIRAVIIDARYNGGGFFGDTYSSFFDIIFESAPPDTVFYFMNHGTLSASIINGSNLAGRGAVLVGQPSGQNVTFFGFYGGVSLMPVVLRYSGWTISVPNMVSTIRDYSDYLEISGDGILMPHVLINTTIHDWINNRDPLFDYVLSVVDNIETEN